MADARGTMKRMFGTSLRKELLFFVLSITILTIIITAALGATSTQIAGNDAENATGVTLREQVKQSLVQLTQVSASQQDEVFRHTRDEVLNLSAYTAHLYDDPALFPASAYWNFDDHVYHKDGKILNKSTDVSTIFIPNFLAIDPSLKRNLELTSYLDFIVPDVMKSDQNAVAMYAISAQGVSRYYPNISLGDNAPPDYDSTKDIVFVQGTPPQDPDKHVVWSPLYDDPAGRGLMITATAPVYSRNTFQGVFAADVLLNSIIANIISYSPVEGSYSFLIDKKGEAIAFPDKAYKDILGRNRNPGEVRTDLASSSPDFLALLDQMQNGKSGFSSVRSSDGRELFVSYAPLQQTGFTLGIVADAQVALKAAATLNGQIAGSVQNTILTRVLPTGIILIIIASLISIFLVTRIVRPLQELTRGAREIGVGNFDYKLHIQSKNEIGELAVSFSDMSHALKRSLDQLKEYSRSLEEKVKERTQDLSDANAQQENLLHFISHEIKGYLTKGEAAFSEIADGDFGVVPDSVKKLADTALLEMRKGVVTVMQILDASNLKKGTISFAKKQFDLRATVEKISAAIRSSAEEKHLSLELTIADAAYSLAGDEDKLSLHVFRNLIDNAVKYTPSGSIHVSLARDGSVARFIVQDSGVGITPEDMKRLFTEGGHGKDSIKVNVHSTGYGLFIAKQVVDAHHGKIWAESDGEGKGSRFIVELPLNA